MPRPKGSKNKSTLAKLSSNTKTVKRRVVRRNKSVTVTENNNNQASFIFNNLLASATAFMINEADKGNKVARLWLETAALQLETLS